MVFNNSTNSSNNDFQTSSGTLQFANRTRMHPGYTENLGISYNASTFSVTGATASLSATNPAYVVLPSNANKGQQILYSITADQTFVDDSGSSTIAGNTFGTTAGVGWGNDCPFYLYAVSNASAGSPETAVNFMIARVPNLTTSPVAGKIGKTGSSVADSQGSLFSLGNITVADYASSPCVCMGSFRMQKTTAGTDDWTVSALAVSDGIGQFNDTIVFTFPTGENGNATGSFTSANGGTAPIWNSQTAFYSVSKQGLVSYVANLTGSVTTNGVGAVSFKPNVPLAYGLNTLQENQGLYTNNTPTTSMLYMVNPSTEITTIAQVNAINPSTAGVLNNADFTSAIAATIVFKFGFMASTS